MRLHVAPIAALIAALFPLASIGCSHGGGGGSGAVTVFVTNDDASIIDIDIDDGFGGFSFVGSVFPGATESFDFCECDVGYRLEAVDSNNQIVSDSFVEDSNDWIVP